MLAALHAMRAAKVKLPVNIVLVAEGEEEIGSPHFHQVVQRPDIFAALKKAEGIFIPASWQDMQRQRLRSISDPKASSSWN